MNIEVSAIRSLRTYMPAIQKDILQASKRSRRRKGLPLILQQERSLPKTSIQTINKSSLPTVLVSKRHIYHSRKRSSQSSRRIIYETLSQKPRFLNIMPSGVSNVASFLRFSSNVLT